MSNFHDDCLDRLYFYYDKEEVQCRLTVQLVVLGSSLRGTLAQAPFMGGFNGGGGDTRHCESRQQV